MKMPTLISLLLLILSFNFSFVSLSTAATPETKKFDFSAIKEITPQNVNKVKEAMDAQRRLFMSGAPMNLSTQEIQDQQRVGKLFIEYMVQSQQQGSQHQKGKKFSIAKDNSEPMTKEKFEAERRRFLNNNQVKAVSKKNDALMGTYRNSEGKMIKVGPKGAVYLSGKTKLLYYTNEKGKITFYSDKAKRQKNKSLRGIYNKSGNKITLYGTPFSDTVFIEDHVNPTTRKKNALAGDWINAEGETMSIGPIIGVTRFSNHKTMYMIFKEGDIEFYNDIMNQKKNSDVSGTYDKSTDKIKLSGEKFNDSIFSRYDKKVVSAEQRKREIRAEFEKKFAKRKAELRAKRGLTQRDAAVAAKKRVNYKSLPKDFYHTLKCKQCDMSSLGSQGFNCNWCEIEGSNFVRSDGGTWNRFNFKWAKLQNNNFAGASIREASFYKADLRGADFSGARIGATNFAYANLENASFRNAEIGESLFNGANLKNADFTGAKIVLADFSFATVDENNLKSANLEDVTLKADALSQKLVGVWYKKVQSRTGELEYYEFFNDGTYIQSINNPAIGAQWRLSAKDPRFRVFKEQHFYSVRNGKFVKMTPNTYFTDMDANSQNIPAVYGNQFIITLPQSSNAKAIFTRASGKALTTYLQYRNRYLALRSAYLWNTDVMEKLSTSGVKYASVVGLYGRGVIDYMFANMIPEGRYSWYNRLEFDRHMRHISSILLRDNSELKSGSGYEKMLFLAMKFGYKDSIDYLIHASNSKIDMQYALVKYKQITEFKYAYEDIIKMVEKRVSEL